MKVAVFGLGYVGTVTAACLASHGHDVWGVDVDGAKVDDIRAGRSPVAEPGLDELITQAVADGTLHATTSCADALDRAEVSLVCVGTPSAHRRRHRPVLHPPLGRRHRGRAAASRCRRPPATTAWSSAAPCPPGTIDQAVLPALISGLAGHADHARARPCARSSCARASAVDDFFNAPLMVVGTSDPHGGRDRDRPVRLPGPARHGGRAAHRRVAQVRLQRLPRDQGLVRQRDGPAAAPGRRRLARGHGAVRPRTRCSTSRRPTCAPASRSAAPACPRTSGRCCTWRRVNGADLPLLSGTPGHQRAGDPGRGRPGRRQRRPHRRAARPELQERHRRPAREPQRRAGRAAAGQGLRRPHLRPGGQPGQADRRQPPAHRGQAAAPGPAAGPRARARRCTAPTSRSSPPATRPSATPWSGSGARGTCST